MNIFLFIKHFPQLRVGQIPRNEVTASEGEQLHPAAAGPRLLSRPAGEEAMVSGRAARGHRRPLNSCQCPWAHL